jgi:hypothetical protein
MRKVGISEDYITGCDQIKIADDIDRGEISKTDSTNMASAIYYNNTIRPI